MHAGWDAGDVYTSNQQLATDQNAAAQGSDELGISLSEAKRRFRSFIRTFRTGNNYVYREQLLQHHAKQKHYLEVRISHINHFDATLHDLLQNHPNRILPIMEVAAKETLAALTRREMDDVEDVQVLLDSVQSVTSMRDLKADHVNKLILIPGIVTSATRSKPRAQVLAIRCKSCSDRRLIKSSGPFSTFNVPRTCQASNATVADSGDNDVLGGAQDCGMDPYIIEPQRCEYIDQQTLKLQEAPEEVPTGEMPRNCLLSVERSLVDRVSPGTRVAVMGVYSIFNSKRMGKGGGANVRQPYLRIVGLRALTDGTGRTNMTFAPEEADRFDALARDPHIYDRMWQSVCPSISGDYTVDIKKAVCCLLFGGSRRILPDGMRLRGDINILLLGDPSTAKSQFLKFVEKVAPVGVYTSGKGSSAAGLTASVIRDSKGEFYLEGGAMVLADGGVCCIDEFDKMREQDRVAIHEAMEQQTISVAKAGITTILNSRSSVLAAANPVYGRYDDYKSAAENIDFLPTILSRFDLIFIVRDIRDEERDRNIARHVLGVHINASRMSANNNRSGASSMYQGTGRNALDPGYNVHAGSDNEEDAEDDSTDISISTMKRYISYCRSRCAPTLNEEASDLLRNHYVTIRNDQRQRAVQEGMSTAAVPITVRQLEAIVRLSESLAKMSLSREVTPTHVAEAIRLFKVSTGQACNSGSLAADGFLRPEMAAQIQDVEDQIKRRVAVGSEVPVKRLVDEFQRRGLAEFAVRKALHVMVARGELQQQQRRKVVRRLR